LLEAAHVADRCIQPHVEILARRVRDLEAEIGRVARDVPVGELVVALGAQPFLHLVGGLGLQRAAARPFAQELLAAGGGELEEVMVGIAQFRLGAGHGGIGVLEVGGRVGRTAGLAVVAVLVLGAALGTFALDEAIRQEHVLDRVVILLNGAYLDQVLDLERAVDALGERTGFVRIGRAAVVECDVEGAEIVVMLLPHPRDQLLRRDAFLLGAQHDGRAVGVVGAHVVAGIAAHLLEAHPDVGLDVFDQVAEVDAAVGVGQGGSDEDFAGHVAGFL